MDKGGGTYDCPVHGSGEEFTAYRVYICALLEEVLACGELGVDGRPVQGGDVELVAICCACFPRFDELLEGGYISSLSG